MVMMTRDVLERPSKRLCVAQSGGDDEFRPGRILEIEAFNFMTYGHIKVDLGPSLNLVVGPNGTGKSSIVCAIGIGLAGDTQVLGRAGHIGDFVKRGEDSGWTKISLQGDAPGEVEVVTRKINTRNKSDWFFNDQLTTKKDIQEKVQKYNIQLNNLTQFLPQDRVCEFAKMNPVELLRETEKAVGNPELSENHESLILKNFEMKKLKLALNAHESSLARAVACNEELEADKQRLHERTMLLEKASALKKKIPWLKYDQRKGAFEEAKGHGREAREKLEEAQQRSRNVKRNFEPQRAKRDGAKATSDELQQKRTQKEQNLRKIASHETELNAQVRAKQGEIQDLRRKEASRREKLERAQKNVQDAIAVVENLPPYIPQDENLRNLKSQSDKLRSEEGDRKSQIREKEAALSQIRREDDQCGLRLKEINNSKARLLQGLKNSGAPEISSAIEWVQAHRNEFQKEVFGPVLLEVQVADKDHAKYVEQHVAQYLWRAFVTQTAADRDILMRNIKRYNVPVINEKGQFRPPPRPVTPEMRQLGITHRLDEVIEAPDVVKRLLVGQSGLDKSYIGSAEANRRADEVARLGVRDLWTRENHYRWTQSRYGGQLSTSVSSVRQARLFSENVDIREKMELESRRTYLQEDMEHLQGVIRDLASQLKIAQEELADLEGQRDKIYKEASQQKRRIKEARHSLDQKTKALSMLENEEDLGDAERRCLAAIEQIHVDRVQNVLTLKGSIEEVGEAQMLYAAAHLHAAEIDIKVKELAKDVQKHESEVKEAEALYLQWTEATESCRIQLQRAKDIAEQVAKLTPELQQMFDEMPESIEEIQEAVVDCETQASAVICNNENAILIYEQRREEIRNLTAKTEEKRTALTRCLSAIETIQNSWLPQLRDLVFNINASFSQNFMEMAVAGEVSLDERGTDFDEYGILIKVKFRESGSLQVLSGQHQSGGERSVATILYLISLQDLTYCPFRVVDEINQGMDPRNERKMFAQLVRAASRPNTSQCLLLTPKLLPDLDYSENCTVINVMNGPWISDLSASSCRDGRAWSAMSQEVPSI